jgi:hypothetical protein
LIGYIASLFLALADSATLRIVAALCVLPLMLFSTLWPNYVRVATLSENCALIKDKYFYFSVMLLLAATIFIVALACGFSLDEDMENPYFLVGLGMFFIGVLGTVGLVFKCWRVYAVDKDGYEVDVAHAAWKTYFAFAYIQFSGNSIHEGLLRYREKQGWSNEVTTPRFDDGPSSYGVQAHPPHNSAGTVKHYGPKRR